MPVGAREELPRARTEALDLLAALKRDLAAAAGI